MIRSIIKWVLFSIALILIAFFVPGIAIAGFFAALFATLIIGLVNIFIKPIISFLSLPLNILTLGLFTFVINALLFWLVSFIVPGFSVHGFIPALLGSILFSIFSIIINFAGKAIPI